MNNTFQLQDGATFEQAEAARDQFFAAVAARDVDAVIEAHDAFVQAVVFRNETVANNLVQSIGKLIEEASEDTMLQRMLKTSLRSKVNEYRDQYRAKEAVTMEDVIKNQIKADYKEAVEEKAGTDKAKGAEVGGVKFASVRDGKPTNSVANLKSIFDHYGVDARVNEISKKMEITFGNAVAKRLGMDVSSMSNLGAKQAVIKSLAAEHQMALTETKAFTCAIADGNTYNPIRELILSKPWDGVSRLEDLFATVHETEGFPVETKKLFMRRWLIAAVAAAFKEQGFWHKGVLTFQGKQSLGKTKWIKALVPTTHSAYIRSGILLNVNQKDSVLEATGGWITELGELDATFSKSQIEDLKAFITREVDVIRRPYAAEDEAFPRRTVFAASVNGVSFLNDDTGNDRWWPVSVESLDHDHTIDMQQLWAEVHALYEDGEQWWLTDEELKAQRAIVKDFESANPMEESILSHFNWTGEGRTCIMSATQVLQRIGYSVPTKKQTTECGVILRRLTGVTKPRKSNGRDVYDLPMPYGVDSVM